MNAEALMSDLPFVEVPSDHFAVLDTDGVLQAILDAGIAVCIYDAVLEPGALLHLKAIPDNSRDIELTDEVLTADILLLERTLSALQETAPRAQYWQAKVIAHCPPDHAAISAVAAAAAKFVADWLTEHGITVVDTQLLGGRRAKLHFRPQMGQLRTATTAT